MCECVYVLTFKPDDQWHFQLQLTTGLGDTIGNNGTVDNSTKNVDQDGLYLSNIEQKTI